MSIKFDIEIDSRNCIGLLKIESESEELYRRIINILDNSYKIYSGKIFKIISTFHLIVVELHLKSFINNETKKVAQNVDQISDENARNLIKEIFVKEEELEIFFRKMSRHKTI